MGENKRLKVDYIVGKRPNEIYGMQKYIYETYSRNKSGVDAKIIDHTMPRMPYSSSIIDYVCYPFIIFFKKRDESIHHICTQEQAYLLNYFKLDNAIVTCFDLIDYVLEEYSHMRQRVNFYMRGMLKADRIITISEFSKKDIIKYTGYPRRKIHVIYPGVDHNRYKPAEVDLGIFEKYSLPKNDKIILYVGSEELRKNIDVLMKAFYKLKKRKKNVKLIKVGRPHSRKGRANLRDLIRRLNLYKDVMIIDYVPEDVLPKLYNIADVFVFPSSYEGFGLPPLEAMSCGTPVITSNSTSLPEVVGNAGIMIKSVDVEGLANAMHDVLVNDGLKEDMIKKGLKRAQMFSWEKTARQTLKVYQELTNI